jgi:pimeloyl-ACP methyl ester carboxylesterase
MTPEFMSSPSFPIREADGFRFVDTSPDSDRDPVLFLHGMLGDVSNWNASMLRMHAEGYRTIAPLLPIYSIERERANLNGLLDYLEDFIDRLGMDRYTVAGNSLGGHLGVMLAARRHEQVSSLVLTGASGIHEVDLGSSIMRRRDREYLRQRVETTFYDAEMCTDRLLDSVISIINTRAYVVRLIGFARSVQQSGVRHLLSGIKAPVLLVWGEQDRITSLDTARTFRDELPDAVLETIERCGHAPMMERPDRFNRILLGFLEQVAVRAAQAMAS